MIYNFDELDFKPISVGKFVHKDGFFDVKARPFAVISFRLSGIGEFEIDGRRISVNTGDILFIPSHTPYKVKYSQSESIVAHLADCNYFEPELIRVQNTIPFEELFKKLLAFWNDRHSVNGTKSIIYDVLERIAEDKKAVIVDTAFDMCLAYMNSHFLDPELDIKEVCEHGFISVSSLQRKS